MAGRKPQAHLLPNVSGNRGCGANPKRGSHASRVNQHVWKKTSPCPGQAQQAWPACAASTETLLLKSPEQKVCTISRPPPRPTGKRDPMENINRLAGGRNSLKASPQKYSYLKGAQSESGKGQQLGFPKIGLPPPGTGRRHISGDRVILKYLELQK